MNLGKEAFSQSIGVEINHWAMEKKCQNKIFQYIGVEIGHRAMEESAGASFSCTIGFD